MKPASWTRCFCWRCGTAPIRHSHGDRDGCRRWRGTSPPSAALPLKMGFDRVRPDLVPHGSFVYTASFPSGHALMSAVTYLTLGALLASVHSPARVKAYFLAVAMVLTLLVGVSRVYLGVHWPTDVAAGWSVGAAWALMSWLLMRWLQKRGGVERPA